MGYYADGDGCIKFSSQITDEQIEKLDNTLSEVFEINFDGIEDDYDYCIYVSHCGKYSENDVTNALDEVSKIAKIKNGEIEFSGEDCERWRFIWKDGEWLEQYGKIVYE